MTPSQLADLKNDDLLRKHLAKLMARDCFRNSRVLEDFHGGTSPSSETADFSDVRVVSPFGEIAWNDLSRLSDDEMKALVIDLVDRCYDFLMELCSPHGAELVEELKTIDKLPNWNDPQRQSAW
jgi:hypothetical protein